MSAVEGGRRFLSCVEAEEDDDEADEGGGHHVPRAPTSCKWSAVFGTLSHALFGLLTPKYSKAFIYYAL